MAAKKKAVAQEQSASKLIHQRIVELGGWRGETLARMRQLILAAGPEITEEWKWDVPVWSHHGIICTGEAYTKTVKLTFAKGASLPDPAKLFNSSLGGGTRRAIDITEGATVNARAFKALVKAAATHNAATAKKKSSGAGKKKKPAVRILSGDNPQIAKADGDAPVQAWIDAVPDWKSDRARELDAVITSALPNLRKAIKWNSPFYGVEGRGFFLGMHTFKRYIKLAFFQGAHLRPLPPGPSKDKNTRYLDVYETDEIDAAQLTKWVRQAAKLPLFLDPKA